MRRKMLRLLRGVLVLLIVAAAALFVARAWDSQRGAWHTHVPRDLHAAQIDKADWAAYLTAEEAVFREVRAEVVDKLDEEARTPGNRYYAGSPIPATSRRIGTARIRSSPTGLRSAQSFSSMA